VTLSIPLTSRAIARAVACALVAGATGAAGNASALGIVEAYQAALKNDQTYQAAYFESEAGKENKALGRSQLLPQLSSNVYTSKNRADILNKSTFLGKPNDTLTHPQYFSRSASVSVRQPIVNFEATARYREGNAQSKASEAIFAGRKQELALRVVGAYFDGLFAAEQLALITAQRNTYREQSSVNQRLFESGEGARTDMIETQARLDLSEAQVIEASDNQRTAMANLAAIIGQEPGNLDPLVADFRPKPIGALTLSEWKKLALTNNPDVQSLMAQADIAREGINKMRAGHMPRLDFVASYTKADAETLATNNQETTVRSIGLQMSIPLYSGGYYSAATRQAVANHERSKAALQAAIDKSAIDVSKEFALVESSAGRIDALVKAVESSKLLIKATEQSIKGGIRINLDLLNAKQQLYSSQRDLAQARFSFLLSNLRLQAIAGSLAFDDVREVASYFR
jgi:protease secretion system outer membrane protein